MINCSIECWFRGNSWAILVVSTNDSQGSPGLAIQGMSIPAQRFTWMPSANDSKRTHCP